MLIVLFITLIMKSACYTSTFIVPLYYHKLLALNKPHIVVDSTFYTSLLHQGTVYIDDTTIIENKLSHIQSLLEKMHVEDKQTTLADKDIIEVIIIKKENNIWKKVKNPTYQDLSAIQANKSIKLIAIITPWDPYISCFR